MVNCVEGFFKIQEFTAAMLYALVSVASRRYDMILFLMWGLS